MTENERKVIEAARAWASGKGDPMDRMAALQAAVSDLEADRCSATGILGDPAWPIAVSCERATGHEGYHMDPARRLEWRSAR